MAYNIQVFSNKSSDYTQIVELDEISVTIRMKFNIRDESWYMSIDTDNNSIKDIRVPINYPVLRQHKALMYDIPGDFFVQKINDIALPDINYSNLGTDFLLLYYTEEEMDQWYDFYNIS